jgi:hypothetical protein
LAGQGDPAEALMDRFVFAGLSCSRRRVTPAGTPRSRPGSIRCVLTVLITTGAGIVSLALIRSQAAAGAAWPW